MQEVREFDSPRLHQFEQDFCRGGRPVRRGRNGRRARSPRGLGERGGPRHRFASCALAAEQALHALRRLRDDRADPVAAVPVDGLGAVTQEIGDLLDRRSGVEGQRHGAVAKQAGTTPFTMTSWLPDPSCGTTKGGARHQQPTLKVTATSAFAACQLRCFLRFQNATPARLMASAAKMAVSRAWKVQ